MPGYGQSLHEYLLQDHSAACQGIFQCELIGFDYMGAIIWQKKTTMNSSGGAKIMGSYPYPPNGMIERLRIHSFSKSLERRKKFLTKSKKCRN
jgi:DNA modification methylase